MTRYEAIAIIDRTPQTYIEDPNLIGWECLTTDINPTKLDDIIFLAKTINDCDGTYGRPIPHIIAKNKANKLSLWNLPLEITP